MDGQHIRQDLFTIEIIRPTAAPPSQSYGEREVAGAYGDFYRQYTVAEYALKHHNIDPKWGLDHMRDDEKFRKAVMAWFPSPEQKTLLARARSAHPFREEQKVTRRSSSLGRIIKGLRVMFTT